MKALGLFGATIGQQWGGLGLSASTEEIAGFLRAVSKVARDLGLETPGYRMLANMGDHGGQEVPHLHIHLFGGRPLGRMVPSA